MNSPRPHKSTLQKTFQQFGTASTIFGAEAFHKRKKPTENGKSSLGSQYAQSAASMKDQEKAQQRNLDEILSQHLGYTDLDSMSILSIPNVTALLNNQTITMNDISSGQEQLASFVNSDQHVDPQQNSQAKRSTIGSERATQFSLKPTRKPIHSCFEIKLQPGCNEAYILALNIPKYEQTCRVLKLLGHQQDLNAFDPKAKADVPYWLK